MKTQEKNPETKPSATEIATEVAKHTKAAEQHETAAKHHRDAIMHYKQGDTDAAYEKAVQAHNHQILMPVYDPKDKDQHAAM